MTFKYRTHHWDSSTKVPVFHRTQFIKHWALSTPSWKMESLCFDASLQWQGTHLLARLPTSELSLLGTSSLPRATSTSWNFYPAAPVLASRTTVFIGREEAATVFISRPSLLSPQYSPFPQLSLLRPGPGLLDHSPCSDLLLLRARNIYLRNTAGLKLHSTQHVPTECMFSAQPLWKPGQGITPLTVQPYRSEIYFTSLTSHALHFPYPIHH